MLVFVNFAIDHCNTHLKTTTLPFESHNLHPAETTMNHQKVDTGSYGEVPFVIEMLTLYVSLNFIVQ